MVVRRSARSVVEMARAGRATDPPRQDHRAAFPPERLPGRGRALPADLQRRDGQSLGIRHAVGSRIPVHGQTIEELALADQVLLAEIDGRPVGFSITLPDINEAIRPLNGRLTRFGLPLGLLRLLRGKRHVKTARMVVLNVLKEYRRRGVAEMLILHTLDYGKNVLGYTGAELGWTLEDNDSVNRTIEAVGGNRYKTYRIYQKDLPRVS